MSKLRLVGSVLGGISNAVKGSWSHIPDAVKGTMKWAGLIGAGAVGVDALRGGHGIGGLIRGGGQGAGNVATDISSSTALSEKEFGWYKFIGFLARILDGLGVPGGIPQAMMSYANRGIENAKNPTANGGFGPNPVKGFGNGPNGGPGGDDPNGNDPGNGFNPTLPILGAGAAGYGIHKILKGRAGASAQHDAHVQAYKAAGGEAAGMARAEGALARASRFGGKWGRLAGILGGVGLGGFALFGGGSEAEAATVPTPGSTRAGATVESAAGGAGSLQSIGADIGGAGLSIVGARMAAEGISKGALAVAAPVAAKLGLEVAAKSIPGIASIYAAGETVFNVGSDLLKGDFKRAGLNLVSGVGETVAGLGGGLTYFTLGAAWRESVRAGGAAVFGEENTIDHSLTYQGGELLGNAGKWLMDQFSNATSGPQTPAPRQDYTFRPAGLALGM